MRYVIRHGINQRNECYSK